MARVASNIEPQFMKTTTLHLHPSFTVAEVDPRVFGGFLEHLGRAVYDGIYKPESAHADDLGCRTDTLDALRRLSFTAMRYPGGNFVSGYHWQDAVGPRAKRPVTRDLAWHSLETNQFGPNEFIELCGRMDWTPMLAVNLGTGTPEEAKNWLEYCNIGVGSKWSNLRAEHGYEDPFNVKLWCLGNEMDGPWQMGHMPAERYADLTKQTARLMKMCDPGVEVVACGSCGTELPTFMDWDRKVLEYLGEDCDYLSIHSYVGNSEDDTPEFLATIKGVDRQIEAADAACKAAYYRNRSKRRTYISFDEWNVWYRARSNEHVDGSGRFAPHLLEEVYNLEDALVVAQYMNSFIRHADSVKIANIAQIVNVIAPILTQGDNLLLQTIFFPIEMYSRRRTGTSLEVRVDGPGYETRKFGKVDYIDASAILNEDKLSVFLVNRDASSPMQVKLDTAGMKVKGVLCAEVVCGPDAKSTNTFENPNVVRARPHDEISIKDGVAIIEVPAMSVFAGTLLIER